MKVAIAAALLLLAGCDTTPLTPEQASVLIQMNQTQQANNAALFTNMQNNPLFQRQQPLYTQPARTRPLNCVTRHVGSTSYTDCY